MEKLEKLTFNTRQICLTAYKGLFLLKHLIAKPLNKEEIIALFKNDDFIPQNISQENIRLIINTLKELGCVISKPEIKNNYKYELLKTPFCLNLSKEEVVLINKFRKNFIENVDLDTVLGLNSLINIICFLIENSHTKETLQNQNELPEIKLSLIEKLKQCCKNKSTVIFEYISGKKISILEMQTSFLKYEKGRLYIWGFSSKYNDFSYLRVDKIKNFKVINNESKGIENNTIIRYRLFNTDYFLENNEVFVEKKDNELIIDYYVENNFKAIQKFLEFGDNCKIISPNSFKSELIQTIRVIRRTYYNG